MGIRIGNLAKAVMKELDAYGVEVGLEVEKVSKEVAKDAARRLNKESPKRTGDYAESWTVDAGKTKRTRHTVIVHAETPEYRLSHLLEKGHQCKKGGRVIGHAPAQVHIAPVEKSAVEQLERELRKRL